MDGNNFNNNQGNGDSQYSQNQQYNQNPQNNQPGGSQYTNNYQDNTANSYYYQPPVDSGRAEKANGKQIAGLVFGILAIVSSCCYGVPGLIFGIVGLILSIMGNKEGKHGVGVAGLVCSIIGMICGVLMTAYYVFVFYMLMTDPDFQQIFDIYMNM